MKQPKPRRLGVMLFDDVIRAVVERAMRGPFERPAIYVVALNDPAGLSLAMELHARHGGPDPAATREQKALEGLQNPFFAAAAPASSLVRALRAKGRQWENLAEAVQHVDAAGGVAVLLIADDVGVVSSFAALTEGDDPDLGGWAVNAAGGEA